MRRLALSACAAALGVSVACGAQRPPTPPELPTRWEPPPGDPLEHSAAGFAKVLCSAIFITGRDAATAARDDGFFVSPLGDRATLKAPVVDRERRAVSVTLPNGVTRTAKFYDDQGCVTLPRGADSAYFVPERFRLRRATAAAARWPEGDVDLVENRSLPREIDSAKLTAAVAAAFDPPDGLTAAFVVAYKGEIVAERYANGATYNTPLPGWSMGKSLTATLVGQLVHEGVYSLWAPAPVDEWQRDDDPRKAIRLADLLRMSSGLRFMAPQDPDFDPKRGYPDHLYVYTGAIDGHRWAITRPPQWPPNTVGRYRNSDPLALNHLIRKAVVAKGMNYLRYPQEHLFDRLGIHTMTLETDPYGNFLLQGYELGSARDWLRLGLLYLQDGMWRGERLLPAGWVDFVRTPAPAWARPEYGGMFWLNRTGRWPVPEDAFFMSGVGGQNTIIIPTHDLVVVRMGHYRGADSGTKALRRALELLMQAVPPVRAAWQPPATTR